MYNIPDYSGLCTNAVHPFICEGLEFVESTFMTVSLQIIIIPVPMIISCVSSILVDGQSCLSSVMKLASKICILLLQNYAINTTCLFDTVF